MSVVSTNFDVNDPQNEHQDEVERNEEGESPTGGRHAGADRTPTFISDKCNLTWWL